MHCLTCAISSLLHSVNLMLFTLLMVHLILRISPHHSHHLRSRHLSLPQPFTPDLKPICSTNPFLHSLPGWTRTELNGHWRLFVFSFFFIFCVLVTCARLSWPHRQLFGASSTLWIGSYRTRTVRRRKDCMVRSLQLVEVWPYLEERKTQ